MAYFPHTGISTIHKIFLAKNIRRTIQPVELFPAKTMSSCPWNDRKVLYRGGGRLFRIFCLSQTRLNPSSSCGCIPVLSTLKHFRCHCSSHNSSTLFLSNINLRQCFESFGIPLSELLSLNLHTFIGVLYPECRMKNCVKL